MSNGEGRDRPTGSAADTRRIQLWSYNYDPEPTGIGPVSATWARAMRDRGHDVSVVAAHPHYPIARWGTRLLPYQQLIDGIRVVRLPLWIGRSTANARLRQEASFAAALGLAAPFLGRPDVIVAVSPSLPALADAMLAARLHRIPWILWLQDLVRTGAETTGLLAAGHPAIRAARRLERLAYASASKIVVVSDAFRRAVLEDWGALEDKVEVIYNPATRPMSPLEARPREGPPKIISIGNIGHSQGLASFVRTFERSAALRGLDAQLVLCGYGLAVDEVEAEITSDRVKLTGLVSKERLERELGSSTLAVVSQRRDIQEFNLPSRLMNFMGCGLPVLATVPAASEVAILVESGNAGWVTPAADAAATEKVLVEILGDPDELDRRGAAGYAYAEANFTPAAMAARFEALISQLVPKP